MSLPAWPMNNINLHENISGMNGRPRPELADNFTGMRGGAGMRKLPLLPARAALCLACMLLIVAALQEELDAGLTLCADCDRLHMRGIRLWQARRNHRALCFLKTGVGPKRSAERLEQALAFTRPSHILVIGYAGALDTELRLGDLVAVQKAMMAGLDEKAPDWEHARMEDVFELDGAQDLVRSALSSGLHARAGNVLTSPYVLGEPAHKLFLHDKFGASIVDMETAALARVSLAGGIPISCMRAISDETRDTFLAPFSYDPSAGIPARAKKLAGAGMAHTLRQWREHASAARENLARFLSGYL